MTLLLLLLANKRRAPGARARDPMATLFAGAVATALILL
jgi:hypothetical protein